MLEDGDPAAASYAPRPVLLPDFRTDLPVTKFKDQILQAVAMHPAVIIVAETGSGKTTEGTRILHEAGYDVTSTQPRRLPSSACASYLAWLFGEPLGETVGFCHAFDRIEGPKTRIRFVTDGYELVKSLVDPDHERHVLVLDELHEWNKHQEALLAWAVKAQSEGKPFKLVIMSATLEAERLSKYLGGAPIINIPGRVFPIEDREAGNSIIDDAAALAREGRNTLIFVPGKREIQMTIAALEDAGVDAEIVPLHGQLPPSEQELAFRHYDRPKIVVCTNVAQTSVTIDDIDAVIDSGLERRIEVVDGVETLDIHLISLACSNQRRGRAGRTREGIYIWHGEVPRSALAAYPTPEIQRLPLDQTDLRFACAGINMEALTFFHQPPRESIKEARRKHKALGLRSPSLIVTPLGRAVASLPLDTHTAATLIHASLYEDEVPGILRHMISIAAISQVNGITVLGSQAWRKFCPSECDSDLFAQLAAFRAAHGLSEYDFEHSGIKLRDFNRAREVEAMLLRRLKVEPGESPELNDFSGEHRKVALESIWAGMVDKLHRRVTDGYTDGDQTRTLSKDSVVKERPWLVGKTINIGIGGDMTTDTEIVPLLTLATAIDPKWHDSHAPEWVKGRSSLLREVSVREQETFDPSHIAEGRGRSPRMTAQPFRGAGGRR
jgi:HrpA-like RNA helicase